MSMTTREELPIWDEQGAPTNHLAVIADAREWLILMEKYLPIISSRRGLQLKEDERRLRRAIEASEKYLCLEPSNETESKKSG